MRIQHNIMALNAYRNYNSNTSALSKNLEKLSSGYKINRAGDDAAGLAISEKMRAQITGLEAATKNVKDGISLVKTAEGAMQEIHDMLNRMDYLATQSANGTYDNEVDRANLQKEVEALRTEIDRIADSSNFNGIALLDGSLAGGTTKSGTVEADLSKLGIDITANAVDIAAVKGVYDTNDLTGTDLTMAKGDSYTFTVNFTDADGNEQSVTKTLVMKDNTSTSGFVLDDGSENGVSLGVTLANAGKVTEAELAKAVAAALNKDDAIKANFTVADSTNALTFTAREGGTAAAAVTSITSASTVKATDVTTAYATKVDVTTKPADATKAYDLANAAVWNNDGNSSAATAVKDLEDAIFEVNGEKFVFVNGALTDENLAAMKEAGVQHYVQLATTNAAVAAADVTAMAEKIAMETGLKVEQGSSTGTTWAAGTTDTEVVFKNNEYSSSTAGKGLTLQIGDTADNFNQMTVSVSDMHAKALGIGSIDIGSQEGAAEAVQKIKDAINAVSSTRGDLGAIQNRLEHTQNNLSVMTENITDAESSIRDTDIADEMTAYTKNNILLQSAQAMLAQANQVPQGVLQLLQ